MLSIPDIHSLPAYEGHGGGPDISVIVGDSFRFVLGHVKLIIFGLIFVTIVGNGIKNRYFHPLSKIPGPFWGSITNLYCSLLFLTGESHTIEYACHKRYGKNSCIYG